MRNSFFLFLGLCLAVACSGPDAEPQPLCLPFGTAVDEWAGLLEEPADGVCRFERIDSVEWHVGFINHEVIVTDSEGRELRRDTDWGWDGVLDSSETTEFDSEGRVTRRTDDYDLDGVLDWDERWAYDESGLLTYWERSASGESSSLRNTYDEQGHVIRTEEITNGGTPCIESWAYDAEGREVLNQRRDADESEPHYREVWEYSASGNLLQHLVDTDFDVGPELDERWSFDAKDRMVSYLRLVSTSRGIDEYREYWTWEDPDLMTSHTVDTDGDEHIHLVELWTWNAQGLAESYRRDGDGDGIPEFVELWTWDDRGLKESYSRDNNGDGVPELLALWTWDAQGLKESYTRDENGDGVPEFIERWTWIVEGLEKVYERDDDGDGQPDFWEHWVFDGVVEDPILVERDDDGDGIINYREEYTPSAGGSTRVLEYDDDDDGQLDARKTMIVDGDTYRTNRDDDGDGVDDSSTSATVTVEPLPTYEVPTDCSLLPDSKPGVMRRLPLEIREDTDGDGNDEEVETWRYDLQGHPLAHTKTDGDKTESIQLEVLEGWLTCRSITHAERTYETEVQYDERLTLRQYKSEVRDANNEVVQRKLQTFNRNGNMERSQREKDGELAYDESWTYLESCVLPSPEYRRALSPTMEYEPPRPPWSDYSGAPGWPYPLTHVLDADGDGHADSGERWTYDDQGRLVDFTRDVDGDGELDDLQLWSYDREGHLVAFLTDDNVSGWSDRFEVSHYGEDGREWVTTTGALPSVVWQFDEHGRKLSMTEPPSEDGGRNLVAWSYDEQNAQLVLTRMQDGEVVNKWIFTGACNDDLAEWAPEWASWSKSNAW